MVNLVLVCGKCKNDIFISDTDKNKYPELTDDYVKHYHFKLYAYSSVNNPIHLLREQAKVTISKIMQGIQQTYTQYLNIKYNPPIISIKQGIKLAPVL